jgi:hypothetical protein
MKIHNTFIKNNPIILTGIVFLFLGILVNEWSIARFISRDGTLSTYSRYIVWVLDLILIIIGCILIIQKDLRVFRWIGVVILAAVVVSLLVGYAFRMGYSFQIDYNEGWNVYQSLSAIAGKPLYSDYETLAPVIYPPISFFIVGYAGKLLHDPLLAGRAISLISLLIISLEVGVIVRLLGGDNFSSIFSSIYCLGIFVVYARGYVAMNDPQMLAHVFMLTGLVIYLKNKSQLIVVAFLCCLALFTKHNLFPIPLAITLDVLLHSRKDFIKWIIANLMISSSFLVLILFTLGSGFFYQILTPRGFDPQKLIIFMNRRLGLPILINLVVTTPWLYHAVKNKFNSIVPSFMVMSGIWGIFALSGNGSDINLLFDFFIGLSITTAMSVFFVCKNFEFSSSRLLMISILLPLSLGIVILKDFPERFPRRGTFYSYENMEHAFLADAKYLSSKSGPLICSNMLLCYFADHSLVMDPFLTTEGILSGRFQEDEILAQLERGYYQVVQLDYPISDRYLSERSYTSIQRSETLLFTENFLRALGNNYVLTRETSTGAFYEPKTP